jgi:DNA mismatch repair protein MutL
MPIQVMPSSLASQIAAGEVVERPASVVKELLENALDAGATDVHIETREGGRRLIRLADNGSGIAAGDIALAFTRHATSKLFSAEELNRIHTLGFRGEALAAIASVAQVTCVSRTRSEQVGARIRIDSGEIIDRGGAGTPAGTIVTVENLFHAVPARLKFLKNDATERRHIDALVSRYAMAYPHVRFQLMHDNRIALQTTGNGELIDVLLAVYGSDVAAHMLAIDAASPGEAAIEVSGYVGAPNLSRASRNDLTIFINGRWVQDRGLSMAVIQAYHTMLMVNRFPICIVQVDIAPEEVDVNVHPAKTEVRLRNSDAVFRAVQRSVRRALIDHAPIPNITPRVDSTWQPTFDQHELNFRPSATPIHSHPPIQNLTTPQPTTQPPTIANGALPMLRVIGQIGATYIIAEGPEGMYLIDQHAAHERVLFEKFMTEKRHKQVATQNLLDPLAVEFSPEDSGLLGEHRELLATIGLQLEWFGNHTWLVRSVPAMLAQDDLRSALADLVGDLRAGEVPFATDEETKLITRVCKRAAIKAGQLQSHQEMQELVRQLEACQSPRTCPHGRPTMIHWSADEMAREFGRR